MVKLLIAKGADASKHGESNHFRDDTPLAIAVRAGRIDLVRLLIAGGRRRSCGCSGPKGVRAVHRSSDRSPTCGEGDPTIMSQ